MSLYKRGSVYYYEFVLHGIRYRGSTKTGDRRTAESIEAKKRLEIVEGTHFKKATGELSFKEFVDKHYVPWAESNKKSFRSSDEVYLKQILPVFGHFPLRGISPHQIEKYKNSQAKHLAPASVNRHLALLKTIFNKAIEWDFFSQNPVRKVKMFKENNERTRFLDIEEFERLLAECRDQKLRDFVIVAAHTGMRRGEIQKLKKEDIDLLTDQIRVRDPKSGKDRFVPMNQTVKHILSGPFDFNYNPRKAFESACARAKIKDFTFHDLRHTFASWLVMKGVDLYTVSELLGHSSVNITKRYAHLSRTFKNLAVNRLDSTLPSESTPRDLVTELDEMEQTRDIPTESPHQGDNGSSSQSVNPSE